MGAGEGGEVDANIQKYQAFVKTVECGSFTKAAEALSYSQSGVSRMIADLERDWKVSLLARSRAGVSLTSEGSRLLPFAQSVCAEYDKLQMQVDDLAGMQSGLIRIGTFSSVATHWLPNIIRAFREDYPNIDYELVMGDYSEIESWLLDGRVDCGFLQLPTHPDLEVLLAGRDELMAVVPEDHPLAARERISAEALCDDPFLLLRKGDNTVVSDVFDHAGLRPDVHFTTWDDYAIMAMVECGLGVGILPELILKRVPYRIAVRPLAEPAFRTIGLALRSKEGASLATKRFLEYLDCR
ncbi:MAG: LysR family transcriptional regulator [Gordonibacter sp.]|uniref:LysR family transcriptional regulator n=1 Tax=Gordonibacter sp. TaxID=1968902 RepID=UPI002FC5C60F